MRLSTALMTASLIALTACEIYPPTPKPDYTIGVLPTSKGLVAIPPQCPSYAMALTDPYDNQPLPQFGCATSRNLALMAEQPKDLIQPRELGPTRGVAMVGAVRRYDNNQTRGLIHLSPSVDNAVDVTTSASPASSLTGDVTGGGASSSSSSSSSGGSSSSSSGSAGP
ncbi:MAG: CpaD family pilus assembly protein [Pseudomonadota bacterium]|nr:CpaD family pilus assembly protein [Pseudomonadota bacterium]